MARTMMDAILLLNTLLGEDIIDPAMGTHMGRVQTD
jgi:hypothetical protein